MVPSERSDRDKVAAPKLHCMPREGNPTDSQPPLLSPFFFSLLCCSIRVERPFPPLTLHLEFLVTFSESPWGRKTSHAEMLRMAATPTCRAPLVVATTTLSMEPWSRPNTEEPSPMNAR